jgi:trans-aconitate methyltransferase
MLRKISVLALALLVWTPDVVATFVDNPVPYSVAPADEDKSIPEHDSTKVFFNKIRENVKLPENSIIVLLGWDTGRSSEYIANQVPNSKVVNFTLKEESRDFAAEKYPHPQVEARHGDITEVQPDMKGSADLVYSSWVVGFVPEHKQVDKLRNIAHMLKTGGTCAVLFPIKGSQFSKTIEQVANKPHWQAKFQSVPIAKRATFDPDNYARLMTLAGFKGVRANKHEYTLNFANRAAFEAFVTTGISRYSPHLTQEETKKFVKEIADTYSKAVFANADETIPYKVNMLLALGTK